MLARHARVGRSKQPSSPGSARSPAFRAPSGACKTFADPARFIRIHRSRIINSERVREIHPWSHGDQLVVLHDGTELLMSRRFRARWSHLLP